MEEKAKQIAELLKLLANENRLLIFCALLETPMTVSEIGKYVPKITQSALSQHLKILKAHGLLADQKSGQKVTYSIADQRLNEIFKVLRQYYCDDTNVSEGEQAR
ncbi:MAG: metalloregulator ArsR/SmtB family transcription factor [Firmicutes bacterium]|nr:metalloregulator ArsR/SmtB family transcription factor [Bacillota bacterium]